MSVMCEVPLYNFTNIFYTAIGVFFIWASWGTGRLSVKYLNSTLATFGLSSNWLMVVEFLVAMVMGVVIAIAFVNPQTPQQAIAAGMGWTSLVTRPTADLSEEQR